MELKEALKKYSYATIMTMLFLGLLVFDGDVYECKGNEPPLRECIKLSASNRSCYHMNGRDLCSDGTWELLGSYQRDQYGNIERCTPQGCSSI